MQMKQRERWKWTCQRLGRGEINEAKVQFWKKGGGRIKWEMMYGRCAALDRMSPERLYEQNKTRHNASVDGGCHLNPAASKSSISRQKHQLDIFNLRPT